MDREASILILGNLLSRNSHFKNSEQKQAQNQAVSLGLISVSFKPLFKRKRLVVLSRLCF